MYFSKELIGNSRAGHAQFEEVQKARKANAIGQRFCDAYALRRRRHVLE
jgi:hypothetical protein